MDGVERSRIVENIDILTYCESVPFDLVLYFSISPDSIFFAAYLATADVMVVVFIVFCWVRCKVEE